MVDINSMLSGESQRGKGIASASEEIKACIEICQETYHTCEKTMSYCLEKGGVHSEPKHIQMMMACADMCKTTSHLLIGNSNYSIRLCGICAQICEACAADCARFEDDPMMQACARICQSCAEACKQVVSTNQ